MIQYFIQWPSVEAVQPGQHGIGSMMRIWQNARSEVRSKPNKSQGTVVLKEFCYYD
jgi:hypothetical protein